MKTVKIDTIGFTQTSAESFFGRLIKAGVKNVVDARLNNSTLFAGFAKGPFRVRALSGSDMNL